MSHLDIQDGKIAALGDPIGVRGDHPVHRIGSQAPDRADEEVLIPDVEGMVGIQHAAGHRVHHLEADDAHGDVFIPDALVEAVRNGPGRVEAGQDFFIGRQQFAARDIQDGEVLPGEGQLAVFADGAGAHGYPDGRGTEFGFHPGISRIDGLGQGRGHLRGVDQGLNGLAHLLDGLGVAGVDLHLLLVDLVHQIIKGQKVGIGPGGDGKTGGNGQADFHSLAQVGILAPDPIHHVPVHRRQGQDRFGEGQFLFFPQAVFDVAVDPVQHPVEDGVLVARENIQTLDHAEGVEGSPGRLGSDIGHAEHVAAGKLLLQVGNEVQQLGVGVQQVLEAGIAEAKGGGQVVPGGPAPAAGKLAVNFPE